MRNHLEKKLKIKIIDLKMKQRKKLKLYKKAKNQT